MNALQYNREAISQLASQFGTSVSDVQNNIAIANSKLADIGAQLGMTGMQVINAVQNGDATLGRQLCECCCQNQLAIANQTSALQAQAAANHSAEMAQNASNFAASQLQMAQNHADDRLDVCQQTNTLSTQAANNTRTITDAIAQQSIMINDKFCDLEKRELQNKINLQGDIITQLRGEISNDKQTEAFTAAFNALNEKINILSAKSPNTIPVVYPNLTAVNNTPYGGGFNPWGYGFGGQSYWG